MVAFLDLIFAPFTLLSSLLLKVIRRLGVYRLKISKGIFNTVGVLPITDHYYEPMINSAHLRKPLRDDRCLPGIDLNAEEQLSVLGRFNFNEELLHFPMEKREDSEFYYRNGAFGVGDAEYLYNIVRSYKPIKMIEIGSGHSTLMAVHAIRRNEEEDSDYNCEHVCIEPYERNWLEKLNVTVMRKLVETVDKSLFRSLRANDILFIDSSHIIRPQGDVLFEYLEILPSVHSGVLVHAHDIFTPKDYPDKWIKDEVLLWNEQYLLEAFLSFNNQFRVIGALNYLRHHFPRVLSERCPILRNEISSGEPSSFWMIRN